MTTLYSIHQINGAEFCIQKFSSDLELQSAYVMSNGGCDCPQAHKPTCRHRKMLPEFQRAKHIGDGWFYEWDTRLWRKPVADMAPGPKALDNYLNLNPKQPSQTLAPVEGDAAASASPSPPPAPQAVSDPPLASSPAAGGGSPLPRGEVLVHRRRLV